MAEAVTPGTGQRLGPYEIVSPLGVGGMAEVHRARDTRLQREVAVKILDFEAARHPERLRLFELEARAAGGIAHPAIVTVHDVGREGDLPYVVMELVEGETLQRRLLRGRLPVRKALEIAVQIGHGLAAAHARGILHNDLKPSNVILTRDGRVKILDFGLAGLRNATATAALTAGAPHGDTLTQALFGTAGYIAPERIEGAAPDSRSDVFSLGAVLYEMLAGAPAFDGESAADVLSATTERDPAEIVPPVSPALDKVLRRALEKDPNQRFQSASDFAFALEALSTVTSTASMVLPPPRPRWPRRVAFVLGGIALALAGLALGRSIWDRPLPSFTRLTFSYGFVSNARFAPDGRTVVLSAAWERALGLQLYTARTDTRGARPLDTSGWGGEVVAVSPANGVAFFPGEKLPSLSDEALGQGKTLAVMPLGGGAPREVLPDVIGADWSPRPDSDSLGLVVVRDNNGVRRLEYPVGKVLYQNSYGLRSPRFNPSGDLIAFLEASPEGDTISVIDLSGARRKLTSALDFTSRLAWSPRGDEIWFTAEKITEQRERGSWRPALRAVNLSGRERVVLRLPEYVSLEDISGDGRVLLTAGSLRSEVIGKAPDEQEERNLSWLDGSGETELSRDGRHLMFFEAAEMATYLRPMDGGPPVRLFQGRGRALSPDGRWVVRISNSHYTGRYEIMPTEAGEPRWIAAPKIAPWGLRWFDDGKRMLVTGNEENKAMRAWVIHLETGEIRPITPEGTGCWLVSPDGKTAACAHPNGAGFLYPVDQPLPPGTLPRPLPGFVYGDHLAQWSQDGRYIYVSARQSRPARVFRLDLQTGTRELWRELSPGNMTGLRGTVDPAITPDGRAYAYSALRHLNDLYVVEGVR